MGLIPKQYEKPVFWGVAIIGGLVLLNVFNKGIKGATADVVSGVIGGAFEATAGVLQGAYNAIPEQLHPESSNNIVYQGVNSIGATISGNTNFNLGEWIYDATH